MAKWSWRDRDREIREEFDTHLALETERQIENGLAPDEARDAARRRFGNALRHREDTRAVHGLVWWDHLTHDLRHALRAIRRRPAAATAAMMALGVGIGGPAAVLSLMLSTFTLVSPTVQNPDELVMLWETPPQQPGSRRDVSLDTYSVWREHADMFQGLSGGGMPLLLSFGASDTPVRVRVQTMGVELLPLLGVRPEHGRLFAARDASAGADPVAIASQAFWETHLGRRDDVVGTTIDLHGRPTTIVGVMPRVFWFGVRDVDLWVPLPLRGRDPSPAPVLVIARMKPGDHKQAVHQRLQALAAQVSAAQPQRDAGWGTRVDGLDAAEMLNSEDLAPGFKILLVAAVLGLLAACANIATVMVARGAARHLETAVRAALGAPRARLIRQFLIESIAVALGGGAVAVLIVVAALRLIVSLAPPDLAMAIDPVPGAGLIAGIIVVAVTIGVFAGLGPAFADSRVNLVVAMKATGYFGGLRGNSRLRRALVIAEVTITVMLLAGVTILARGAIELASVGPGFDATRVIQMRVDRVQHLGGATGPPLNPEVVAERFAAIGGIDAVAITDGLLTGERASVTISAADDSAAREQRRVHLNRVSHDYFRVLGLRLIDGRRFGPEDVRGAPVVVVSEAFARQSFPAGRAVGRTLRLRDEATERTIVGVVSSVLLEGFRRQPSPIVYLPYAAAAPADIANGFLVRFTPGAKVLRDMERALAALDPLHTIGHAGIVHDQLTVGAMEVRFTVFLAGPVLLLALALSMSGIYGVLAQSVTQRTHEVALRVALGAERGDVLTLIAFQGVKLTAVGAIVGAAAAVTADRLLGSFVAGVPGERLMALLMATALIMAATLVASLVPCLRAMRIDPAVTLRYE